MATNSSIEWTEATWNPTTGCSKISSGCKNCYAEKLSKRLNAMGVKKYKNNFKFTEQPQDLELPLTWKKPKKIFVNSMSDLFHEDARMEYVGSCFDVMLKANHHQYQVLTKRPDIMADFSIHFKNYFQNIIPPHIWMGTSIENEDFKWRIDALREVQCCTKFLSIEPLLGPMGTLDLVDIDWVIIGGESGPKFRPVKKEWIINVIKQCKKQKVAVFFKQWGGFRPKSGGREINGQTYDDYPKELSLIDTVIDQVQYDEKEFAKFVGQKFKQKKSPLLEV
jgi:protein gp37